MERVCHVSLHKYQTHTTQKSTQQLHFLHSSAPYPQRPFHCWHAAPDPDPQPQRPFQCWHAGPEKVGKQWKEFIMSVCTNNKHTQH